MTSDYILASIIVLLEIGFAWNYYWFTARPKKSTLYRLNFKETKEGKSILLASYETRLTTITDEHELNEAELELWNRFVKSYYDKFLSEVTNGEGNTKELKPAKD